MSSAVAARAIAWIVVAQLLAMSLWFSASAVTPELKAHWQLSDAASAWLTNSVQLGFVVGAFGSALLNLADRVPAERVFLVGALVGAASNAAIAAFDVGAGGAIALRFVTGASLAAVYPPGMKLAASWTVRRRGLAVGSLVAATTFGSALPHLFAAWPSAGDASTSWRTVLWVASAAAVVAAVVASVAVRPGPHLGRSAPFEWRYALRPFVDRPLRLANLGYLGHMWELYAMWTWVPLLLLAVYREGGYDDTSARLAGFAVVAIGAVGSFLAGLLADRFGRTLVAGASLVVSGVCCLAVGGVLDAPVALTVVCLVWGFAVVADSAQFSAALTELADSRYVGTVLAVQTSSGFLLTMVSIQVVPWLVDAYGWRIALALLVLGPVVGVVSMARLRSLPEAAALAGGRR